MNVVTRSVTPEPSTTACPNSRSLRNDSVEEMRRALRSGVVKLSVCYFFRPAGEAGGGTSSDSPLTVRVPVSSDYRITLRHLSAVRGPLA
jgi:hypothetical protein